MLFFDLKKRSENRLKNSQKYDKIYRTEFFVEAFSEQRGLKAASEIRLKMERGMYEFTNRKQKKCKNICFVPDGKY